MYIYNHSNTLKKCFLTNVFYLKCVIVFEEKFMFIKFLKCLQ
jgi:hypothetical protein